MASYLAVLFVFGAFAFGQGMASLLRGAGVVLLYAGFDVVWTYVRDKVWYFPLSSLISGFVLAIVSMPDLPLWLLFFLPLLAVFSKQVLHFGKMRHVFNPAGFAMVVASFFVPVVSWWATGWSGVLLLIVLIPCVFILWRQTRWHVALPFVVSYFVLLSIFYLMTGVPFQNLPVILSGQLLNGTLLFFSTVMLIEPLTSTFPTRGQRVIYALMVAIFSVMVQAILKFVSVQHIDPLIFGLLLGNFSASLLFLPKLKKDTMQVSK